MTQHPAPSEVPSGNPNDYHGFLFVVYNYGKFHMVDRTKGSYRHYLHYLAKGKAQFVIQDQTFDFKAGDFFYLPMDIPYESVWSDTENCQIYSCGFQVFPEASGTSFALQLLPSQFIDKFLEIPLQIRPDSSALAKFYTLLSELVPYMKVAEYSPQNFLLEKITTYLWTHPNSSMDKLARHCGMSRSSLYAKVRAITNKTLHQLKQEVQIDRAKNYLLNTNSSVSLFSEECGFCSPTYFRKIFKEHTGMTPSEFRALYKHD